MEKVAVIVESKIVDNYSSDSKRPYAWNFGLNYLENNSMKSVTVRYDGDVVYSIGNVILYDSNSGKLFDIDKLSFEQVRELELMREILRVQYNDLEEQVNAGDSKLDNATVKFFNHKNRVIASFSLESLKRILNKLDNDIESKRTSKGR